jgi:hypothetical protein
MLKLGWISRARLPGSSLLEGAVFIRSILVVTVLFPLCLRAAAPFFVVVPVQAPTDQDAFNTGAPASAGLLLVRDTLPGETAVQLAGPDGPGPGRIFTRPGVGSYGLTDVGAQWTTPVAVGQSILGLVETYPGQFAWTAKAFVGAFRVNVSKEQLVAGQINVPPVLMMEVPVPQLLTASASSIQLLLPGGVDTSGLLVAWVLWRQGFGQGWEKLSERPVSLESQIFQDLGVTAGAQYRYGLSAKLLWNGGGQAGALPDEPGYLVSNARSESSWLFAAEVQPTPTPFPTVLGGHPTPDLGGETWVAFPNPNRSGMLQIAFHMMKKGAYLIHVYSVDGTLVNSFRGTAELGWQAPVLDLRKLASGIYLVRLEVQNEDGTTSNYPLRKLALVR